MLEAAVQKARVSIKARDEAAVFKAVDAAISAINSLLKVLNQLIAEEKAIQLVPNFELVPAGISTYARSQRLYLLNKCNREAPSAIGVGDSLANMCEVIADQWLDARLKR